MKKIIFLFMFIITAGTSFGASGDILKNLEGVKSLTADFVQINTYFEGISSQSVEDKYVGSLNVIMKDKAIFEYTEPYISYYLLNKDGMEVYDSVMNQLVKYKKASFGGNIFLEILTDFSAISTNFETKELSDKILELTPKNDLGIKYLQITIDDDGKILSMKMEDAAANITELKFNNVQTGIKIPDKIFQKKLPNGVTVIEG